MLSRREFLAAGTAVAALGATRSGALAQTPGRQQRVRDAVPPTSPTPVIGRPSDSLGGTTVNVGSNPGDLQTAIAAAINADGTHKGNTLVCPAGVTYNAVTLPRTTGSGWTCIRSGSASLPAAGTRVTPSHAGAMFKIQSSGAINDARIMFVPNTTSGWRLIGMEGTNPNDNFTYALIEIFWHRMSFERCYLHVRPLSKCAGPSSPSSPKICSSGTRGSLSAKRREATRKPSLHGHADGSISKTVSCKRRAKIS